MYVSLLIDKSPDGVQSLEDHLVDDDPRHGRLDGGGPRRVQPDRRRRVRVGPRVAAAGASIALW